MKRRLRQWTYACTAAGSACGGLAINAGCRGHCGNCLGCGGTLGLIFLLILGSRFAPVSRRQEKP